MQKKCWLVESSVRMINSNKGVYLAGNLWGQKDRVIFLTFTQAIIISLCDGTHSTEDIVKTLSSLYPQTEVSQIQRDVRQFLEYMEKIGAIFTLPFSFSSPIKVFNPNDFFRVPDNTPVIKTEMILSMVLVLNENCALHCIYCFSDSKKGSLTKQFMPRELALKAIREGSKMGVIRVMLGGGEPLLYPYLLDLIKEARKFGMEVELSTKGIFLDEKLASALKKSGLHELQISLDTIDSEVYQKLTQVPALDKAIRGLFFSIRYNILTRVRPTLTSLNIDDFDKLCLFLLKMGVKRIVGVVLKPYGRALKKMQDLIPSVEQIKITQSKVQNLIDKEIVAIQYDSMGDVGPCAGGKFVVAIYPDGDVSFCDSLGILRKHFLLGNLNTHSLKEIWYSPSTDKYKSLPQYSECKKCKNFYTCFGGCPLNSYALWKSFQKPDPLCDKIYKTPPSGEIYDWKKECQRIDV